MAVATLLLQQLYIRDLNNDFWKAVDCYDRSRNTCDKLEEKWNEERHRAGLLEEDNAWLNKQLEEAQSILRGEALPCFDATDKR